MLALLHSSQFLPAFAAFVFYIFELLLLFLKVHVYIHITTVQFKCNVSKDHYILLIVITL